MTLAYHPFSQLFPLMDGPELDELAKDIAEHGLRSPIVLYQGQILDGRNRYRACEIAGVEPRCEDYTGDNPLEYVVSLNLHRRHLTESQRAMAAAGIATMRQGERTDLAPNGAKLSQKKASQLLNVSERSVERAAKVKDRGIAELADAVTQGRVSVSAASEIAGVSPEEQQDILARGEDEILQTAKELKTARAAKRSKEHAKAASMTRYACPSCELNVWGKPGIKVLCGDCMEEMKSET
jgi:ParB-like chromosome segregation protein Spo0J